MRRLNIGCGSQHRDGFINIDGRPLIGVDIVRDVLRGLPFDDDSVDEIYSENFLEHLPQGECIWMMNEMHRIMKPGGMAKHVVPIAGSTNFFQDPTHTAHWVQETFTYFTMGHIRNLYYGDEIMPWRDVMIDGPNDNGVIFVTMVKP